MLGDELRQRRLDSGLTQERLADKAGIDRTYVSILERNLQSPTVDMLIRLCRAMGTRASDVLARVEDDHRLKRRSRR
ncbi:MAG: helix-turn-helix transcriptional regulator [Gemmatimonadaceae bacterium]|nr:helix-turn-helix transcriptional regulator [Gemmatimonadaceae bacterium]NUO96087.1 helix-turn-helix transcriptional regulator [Gemmatimonadaceae bacterium]NUP54290.1 helix-turn-helix transcriptional regulator [Gemmatimonadaceae bacterium]NUP71236.1 helix-turn-helix transcriptional regulator [Gemmatimonadaceae bacterium]NUR36075.1 helix-turn-helix transcriptional regulator [Gemmatimonadaceae bacterium]